MLHVGTSGWAYADWQEAFYPKGITGAKRLPFYAARYDTVEVNATFYRFPTDAMLAAWNRNLPPGYNTSVKGTRRVTHAKVLPPLSTVAYFHERVAQLTSLRTLLWQLPPHRARDSAYLGDLLALLAEASPAHVRHAVEFRHRSWWDDNTYAQLRERGVAFVNVSHPNLPRQWVTTAPFHYVRFHGLDPEQKYRYRYNRRELAPWARRASALATTDDVYVYFNNDFDANALRDAATFRELASRGSRPVRGRSFSEASFTENPGGRDR
ncbi:MAG TPA: DUF72 domain-containing protein [Myxococcota bacterium]|nr:DUF72 domain-containing protein [Myxococcota bacterium]